MSLYFCETYSTLPNGGPTVRFRLISKAARGTFIRCCFWRLFTYRFCRFFIDAISCLPDFGLKGITKELFSERGIVLDSSKKINHALHTVYHRFISRSFTFVTDILLNKLLSLKRLMKFKGLSLNNRLQQCQYILIILVFGFYKGCCQNGD